MSGDWADRIERVVDVCAAVLFASAFGFAGSLLVNPVAVAMCSIAAFAVAFAVLRSVRPKARDFPIAFEIDPIEFSLPVDVLELSEADRLDTALVGSRVLADAILLDDPLPRVSADSRVVQLFGPRSATAGELLSRIDRHRDERSVPAPGDASDALFEALSDLRRSLRTSA